MFYVFHFLLLFYTFHALINVYYFSTDWSVRERAREGGGRLHKPNDISRFEFSIVSDYEMGLSWLIAFFGQINQIALMIHIMIVLIKINSNYPRIHWLAMCSLRPKQYENQCKSNKQIKQVIRNAFELFHFPISFASSFELNIDFIRHAWHLKSVN